MVREIGAHQGSGTLMNRSPKAATPGGAMSPDVEEEATETAELVDPIGHVRVIYLGPIAPHWDVQSDFGPADVIDAFRERVLARLVLLPPHDPQFRRNRERVVRDAERENLT